LELLIQNGANVKAEDSEEGKTALMLACEKGYLEVITKLLDSGAVVDKGDKKKKTALMYAVNLTQENCDIISSLLSKKAEVDWKSLEGQTALLLAADRKHARIVSMLL
jgi:ankyrin repeat protein